MLSALLCLDIFPNKIQLNIKSSYKYQTSTGTILTFVLVAIMVIEIATTMSGIFNFKSSQISSGRSYNINPGSLGLNSSNFVFAVKVNDPFYNLSQAYVSFNLTSQSVIRYPNGSVSFFQQVIPLKPCDLEYMKGFEAEYVSLQLQSALCPSLDLIDVVGTYLNDNYTFLNINVFPCQNDTSQPDVICQPIEQVEQSLGLTPMGITLQAQIFFSNTLFTPSNYTTPVTRFIDQMSWEVNPNGTTIEGDIYVNQQTIISDDFVWLPGYNVKNITTSNIDQSEARTNNKRLQVTGPGPDDYIILSIEIQRSNYVYTTNRTYATVYSGLSSIGGIFSLVVGIFGAIAAIYTRRAYLVTVANEMYEFEVPDHLDKNKNTKSRFCCCFSREKKKIPQRSEETSIPTTLNRDTREAGYSEMYERLSSFYAKKTTKEKSKLDYGFLDFVLGIFCCGRREKDRFVRRAIETISQDTDILHLIKGIHENERLKKVLFSQEQQDLFEHACSPVILTNDLWNSKKSKSTEQASARAGAINRSRTIFESESINRQGSVTLQGSITRPGTITRRGTISRRGTMIQETKDPGDRNKLSPKTIIDSKTPKEQSSEKDNPRKHFISLCRSYQKLFKDYSNPVNYKLIELLDPTLHEALYDMSKVIKEAPTVDPAQDRRRGHNTVLLVKRGNMHEKLEAGMKIAKTLQSRFRERKKNTWQHSEGIDLQEKRVGKNDDKNDSNDDDKNYDEKNEIGLSPIHVNLRITQQAQLPLIPREKVLHHDISPNRPYLTRVQAHSYDSPSDSFQLSPKS